MLKLPSYGIQSAHDWAFTDGSGLQVLVSSARIPWDSEG
jgi:hypothetical protein